MLLISIFLASFSSFSQSMAEIFKLLPADCTPELDSKQRDTLLENAEYTLPGGDSLETIEYTIESDLPNYLLYNYGFSTGQNGFIAFELKKFTRTDGSILIVYSRYGGTLRAYHQHDLKIFDYKNNKLILNKEKLLAQTISIKRFLRKGTPDSIAKKIESYVMATYDLDPENQKSVSYNLFPAVLLDDLEKYLLSDSMILTWNGKSFTKKLDLHKE